jgi:hypothetical protein
LLNVSYKILWVSSCIIRPEQTGLYPGAAYLETVLTSWESVEWAKESMQQILLLKIAFEKTYDKVDWSFILICFPG